jgi:hypothetical protein
MGFIPILTYHICPAAKRWRHRSVNGVSVGRRGSVNLSPRTHFRENRPHAISDTSIIPSPNVNLALNSRKSFKVLQYKLSDT